MRALLFLLALLSILPSPAAAQLQVTYGDGVLRCDEFALCESDADCGDLEPNCEESNTGNKVCTALESARFELLCCAMDEDCGELGGVPGICTRFFDEAAGQEGVGVCRYLDVFDLCLADEREALFDDVAPCFDLEVEVSASLAELYASGDCDDDGTANASDPCPCSSDDACLPTDPDAGKPGLEAPRPGIAGGGGCSTSPSTGGFGLALTSLALFSLGFRGWRRARRRNRRAPER